MLTCSGMDVIGKSDRLGSTDILADIRSSLQATWIRNAILHAIRKESPAAARRVQANVVFQAPTVTALTEAVLRAVDNASIPATGVNTPEDLVRIAEQYATNLPSRPSSLRSRKVGKDVVLITGTTGGFGCDVLEHLLRNDDVAKVYALNRAGTRALDRQHARFRERGLDESLLSSPKFVMVEGTLDAPDFGLLPELLHEVLLPSLGMLVLSNSLAILDTVFHHAHLA